MCLELTYKIQLLVMNVRRLLFTQELLWGLSLLSIGHQKSRNVQGV